ncbi:hypothetical protein [Sedimenticola sp.]|uniref:hypothetical protein n=1 Tax=Sedimenticola sp. TaxID=1940285 RepID=UPI003D0B2D09
MRPIRLFFLLTLCLAGTGAQAGGEQATLLFENHSTHDVKVVAPGRAIILPAGGPSQTITFAPEDTLGVQLNIWWRDNPRELCRLFTPWSRRVQIAGRQTIVCLSDDPE